MAVCGADVRSLRNVMLPGRDAHLAKGEAYPWLTDDLPQVFRPDNEQAGNDGEKEQPLDGMQHPGEHDEQDPDDD